MKKKINCQLRNFQNKLSTLGNVCKMRALQKKFKDANVFCSEQQETKYWWIRKFAFFFFFWRVLSSQVILLAFCQRSELATLQAVQTRPSTRLHASHPPELLTPGTISLSSPRFPPPAPKTGKIFSCLASKF